jgi:hypothetical protein
MKLQSLIYNGLRVVLLASLFLFSPQPALANPKPGRLAHYIVFEKHDDGTIVPIYYRPVELSIPLQSLSSDQLTSYLARPSPVTERVVVTLQAADGSMAYQNVVEISPWLRGEFHGAAAGDPIDGHILPAEHPAFVVRLPMIEGTRMVMKDARLATVAQFDLARLVVETPLISLDPDARAESQSMTGPAANRVDLLVLGDGYSADQTAKFSADSANFASQFFSISPYSVYQNYFNVQTLFTASSQPGADHPPYDPACLNNDPTCCADPAMLSDPLQGQMANTAFDGRFCTAGIHRLLSVDPGKVLAAAAVVPDWDTIMVIVNDTTYGGSGGYISVTSMNSWSTQIAQHEFGHSFVKLADEYEYGSSTPPKCSDITGPACASNVTDVSDPAFIKWNPWILPTTPIPTPEINTYDGLVGLFEGEVYFPTGIYRPGLNCLMRALGTPFCQVPSQSFVLTLYNGGWGVPASGIRLIEPGSTSPSTPLSLTHPAAQLFHAAILEPAGGPPVQISWLDNGIPIPGASGSSFTYNTDASQLGLHKITLLVKDMTPLVHPLMAGTALEQEYTWNVTVQGIVFLPLVLK